MTHRVLAAAFDGWVESAARAARHRRLAARAVRKMTRRTASRAFGRWAHAAGEAQRKAAATERHANRLWRRKTLAAFNGWRDSAATRRRNRAVAMRVVGAVAHQTAYRAFRSWAHGVAESIRKKIAVTRALARMRRRALVDCFYAWLNSAEDARAAWSRAARAEGLARRGERRLRAACHRAWAELAANAGRRRDAEDDAVERATLAVLDAHVRVRRTRLVAGVEPCRAPRGPRASRVPPRRPRCPVGVRHPPRAPPTFCDTPREAASLRDASNLRRGRRGTTRPSRPPRS